MQHRILLLDELGERWGKTHVYHNLRSPCDALKLLYINYPDIQKYFASAHENGISFTVVQAKQFLDYEDLVLPLGQNDLVITPVITGSKGAVKALVGVAIVAATGGFGAAAGTTIFGAKVTGALATVASIGSKIGFGLILGGVTEMLAPQPQLPSFDFDAPVSGFTGGPSGVTRGSDGSQSYGYTGAANTTGLGKTIPVVYGQALIGGHVLSTNIEVANESDKLMKYIRPPSLDSVRLNGEELKYKYTSAGGLQARRYDGTTNNASGTKKYLSSDKTIDLSDKGSQTIVDIEGQSSGNTNVKKFQILFQVSGLVDFVGDDDTTKIDGFITYRVKVKEKSDNNLVLNSQSTIQGLTKKTQKYSYIAKLPYQKVSGKDNYRVSIEIIDTGLDLSQASFKIKQVGYNLKKT